jgi:hypothetical protein
LGDRFIAFNGVDFSVRWGGIPILDFAAVLVYATEELIRGASESFVDFTESDNALQF